MIKINNYEKLLIEADQEGLITKEKPLLASDGRIKNNRIAIRQDIPTQKQKACVLAEELGHHHTTIGNILDQSNTENRKQELRARVWAYNKMIGLTGLLRSYQHGCRNRFEVAEYLDVTEEFLMECLDHYRNQYGICTKVDNYLIYFEPHLFIADMNFGI